VTDGPGLADRSATAAAAVVQHRHAAAVLANRLAIDRRWGRPWLAYNVFIRVGRAGVPALSAVQDQLTSVEPSLLLRMPPTALHITAANLLPGVAEYDRPKDELWQEHGPRWLDQVAGLAATTTPFRLRFRRVVATDAAIIAVADEPNGLSAFRRRLHAVLEVPGTPHIHHLVHATLFRYQTPLRAPEALLTWLSAADANAEFEVGELVVAREHTFPFLGYDVLRRFSLRPGSLASSV
jgi:hypothetical protein